jgi:anthranilate synthase component I
VVGILLETIEKAKIGSIVPIFREVDAKINALEYFAKISDCGKKKNSIFFEDNSKSIGTANPCLAITGKGIDFEITALNNTGKKILSFIKKDFAFCDKCVYHKDMIYGRLAPKSKAVSEQERVKIKTHMDIIKAVAFKFKLTTASLPDYSGLYGIVSHDAAYHIEGMQIEKEDLAKDPDYIFYFIDNMFVADHRTGKTYFIANVFVTDNKKEGDYANCVKIIDSYEKALANKAPKAAKGKKRELRVAYDTNDIEFLNLIDNLKKHVIDGEILYTEASKTAVIDFNAEPLSVYSRLKAINLGDETFYVNDKSGITIGFDSKFLLDINGEDEKAIELKSFSATEQGGSPESDSSKDIENRYEVLAKVDENENAYNIMLIDSMRDSVAKASRPGTRYVENLLYTQKQARFQNIVSSVKGILDQNLDAIDAFAGMMNISAGSPRIKSMELLGKTEKTKRDLCSSSFIYLSPDNNLHSISAGPIRIKKDIAYLRKSIRVFHHSNNEKEMAKADKKEAAVIDAIKSAGGN